MIPVLMAELKRHMDAEVWNLRQLLVGQTHVPSTLNPQQTLQQQVLIMVQSERIYGAIG
jgi:hypothetical protein